MEGVLLIAAIAQKWKLQLDPEQRVEPLPLITLRTKYGMRMKLLGAALTPRFSGTRAHYPDAA